MLYKKILQQLVFTNKTFIVCTLFGLSTLQSCSDKQPSLLPIKSVEFKLDTDVKMSDMFNDYTFIQLESNDDCIIPDITQVYDVNDTLVVLSNTGDVYTFDRNTGKYYGQISGKGEGPEEYIEASDIVLTKDRNVGIVDRMTGSIKVFSLDGKFVDNIKISGETAWFTDAELAPDGKLLLSNKLSGGYPPQKYAYTLASINNGEKPIAFDEFSPVSVGNYSAPFAEKPITACGGELHFLKFLNDTLFSYKKGDVKPLYTLHTPNPLPSKELVAKQGDFSISKLAQLNNNGKFFIGFNNIYETNDILLLVTTMPEENGFYWIDKRTDKGYISPGNAKVDTLVKNILEGKLIYHPVGSSDNEIISCINAELWFESIKKIATENNINLFNTKLKDFSKTINVEGNPCLLLYK